MSATVTAFFRTNTGAPALSLSPTLRIWQIGSPDQLVVSGAAMTEVGDGFYKYDYVAYDPHAEYTFRADGGASLSDDRRYVEGATECIDAEEVWAVSQADAVAVSGSIGQRIIVNHNAMISLLQLLLKYKQNRTLVDSGAKTLTIFDDNGVTPLRIFDLKDSVGNPSVLEVAERVPQ